jgi:hypothetical protein
MMPRLFTKFASKSQTGTGLRLFISKSIVEAHDGRICAETIQMEKERDLDSVYWKDKPCRIKQLLYRKKDHDGMLRRN